MNPTTLEVLQLIEYVPICDLTLVTEAVQKLIADEVDSDEPKETDVEG